MPDYTDILIERCGKPGSVLKLNPQAIRDEWVVMERQFYTYALSRCYGLIAPTARALGCNRLTVQRAIKRLGINVAAIRKQNPQEMES